MASKQWKSADSSLFTDFRKPDKPKKESMEAWFRECCEMFYGKEEADRIIAKWKQENSTHDQEQEGI